MVCLESKCGDYSGLWNRYGINDDGNRVMSVMSLWCLYCWLWAWFTASSCVSFVDFERVNADCLDMFLFHVTRLTLLPVTSSSKYDLERLRNIFTYFDTAIGCAQRLFLCEQLQLHFCLVYFGSLRVQVCW